MLTINASDKVSCFPKFCCRVHSVFFTFELENYYKSSKQLLSQFKFYYKYISSTELVARFCTAIFLGSSEYTGFHIPKFLVKAHFHYTLVFRILRSFKGIIHFPLNMFQFFCSSTTRLNFNFAVLL